MKRMEINGGGDDEEYGDEWLGLRLELGLGFRDRV